MPIVNPIIQVSGGASRTTAKLMKTGQTVSYRTGDDGDIKAGRSTNFFTLAENNPFGNTNRFTDELGGQTYTNSIVIDWSTYDGYSVLGWSPLQTSDTWNNAIDNGLIYAIGGFSSGWRLSNRTELLSLVNIGVTSAAVLGYAPFNLNINLWTSSTYKGATYQAWYMTGTGVITVFTKTGALAYLFCRDFTVTGTILT